MEQKSLISRLQELKQIKPNQDWVVFNKRQLLGATEKINILETFSAAFALKTLAYASLSLLVIFAGVLAVAQYSLPGSPLFSLKKVTEYSVATLLPGVNQSKYSLNIANKRLSDLSAIVSTKQTSNIPEGIQEFKESVSNVADNMVKTDKPALQQITARVESLGAMINNGQQGSELNSALAPLVDKEISDLENSTLTDTQKIQLDNIKEIYGKGEFALALEDILLINK